MAHIFTLFWQVLNFEQTIMGVKLRCSWERIEEQVGNLGSHMKTWWEYIGNKEKRQTIALTPSPTQKRAGPLMSACWALAWLASKFDLQKCLSWVLAWENDTRHKLWDAPPCSQKSYVWGQWTFMEVAWSGPAFFTNLCMKYSWDGDHIFALLLGMWGCAFHVSKTKTISWNLRVSQALWHSLLINLYLVVSVSVFPLGRMSLEVPSPPISRPSPPPPPPFGITMSTKDTAVRRAGQQEISSQPPCQVVGRKTASHLLSQVVGIA
jgi:hypothetical protein